MKRTFLSLFLAALTLTAANTFAQKNKCSSAQHLQEAMAKDAGLRARMEATEKQTQRWIAAQKTKRNAASLYTIPVVVHVIYNADSENVSNEQILSQLIVMNNDFRKMNPDTLDSSHAFSDKTADTGIEFCLASIDPSGNPTTGITRTKTSVATWTDELQPSIKSTADGGHDNWDPTKYLNLYVVNLDGTTLGFATFPDELASSPSADGVVIRFEAFGTIGTAGVGTFAANNGGRTATHEVGHWLNLRHIWGDTTCGNDFVDDTEIADQANYNCPAFPHNANSSCGTGANGEMYMNYMDYVDDNCMHMFTKGQAARMQAALNGPRSGLLTSQVCGGPTGVKSILDERSLEVYPNPSNGVVVVNINGASEAKIQVLNVLGQVVKTLDMNNINTMSLNLGEYGSGMYYIRMETANGTITKKVVVRQN